MKKWIKKWKMRFFPSLLGKIGRWILWVIVKSCSLKISGDENLTQFVKRKRGILVLWHNRLLIIPELLNKVTKKQTFAALVSNSRDGQLLEGLVTSYARGKTIRVASHEKHKALHTLIKHLKTNDDIVVITPDGPSGPKYQVKKGAVFAAEKSTCQVLPLSWHASRFWELPTWDKMKLPKPFSTIYLSFGPEIEILENQLPSSGQLTIKQSLDQLEFETVR